MAKKVLPKAQPGRTMSSDQLRREQNRTGKTAEEYYKSEDYARVQRRLDELNGRSKPQPRSFPRPTASPDKRSTNEKVGITPPTGNNPLKTGRYKGAGVSPAQIKQYQEDWKKKEREKTNPNNRPVGSPLTPLKRGGMIKKKK